MEAIWHEVKAVLKNHIPGHSFRMWVEPLELCKVENGEVTLSCPNFFSRKRVLDNYASLIESEIKNASGRDVKLSLKVKTKKQPEKKNAPCFPTAPIIRKTKSSGSLQMDLPNFNVQPQAGRILRRDFTFDNFVVGDCNNYAYSAALSLATSKSSDQSSLFFRANTGLGKSHLSQAIGHKILSVCPNERVCYATAEDFTNEMIHAIKHASITKFKEKYRTRCDVLILEDIHFLTGKERTQVELAQALDYLLEANKKIIFSSCYLPVDIPKISEQLRSRINCGLISNIDPPGFRTRVQILRKKSMEKGLAIPDNVTQYLASELADDVRQLESGLIGVAAKSALLSTPINLNLAQSVVKNLARQKKSITIDVIKKLVCQNFKISVRDIVSRSRKQSIVRPRQIAIFLARRYTDQPLQSIGKSFNRQHATAIHAIGIIEREMKGSGPMKKQVDILCKKLDTGKF